jgi:TonB family protein
LFAPPAVEAASDLAFAPMPDPTLETFSPLAQAASALEVEAEPVPPLAAEEAALLESMPAPVAPPSAADSEGAKGFAWQPALKALPEVASASAPAASFTALAPSSGSAQAIDPPPSGENSGEAAAGKAGGLETGLETGLSSSENTATGVAPAKEISAPVLDLHETKALPPTTRAAALPASKKAAAGQPPAAAQKSLARSTAAPFPESSAFSPGEEEDGGLPPGGEENTTKNLIIAALLVLGLAASGYFAWPRLQPLLLNLPIVQKYFGAPRSEVPAPLSPALSPRDSAAALVAAPLATGVAEPSSASESGPTGPQAPAVDTGRAGGGVEPAPVASAAASRATLTAAGVTARRAAGAHPSVAPGRDAKLILVQDDLRKNSARQPGRAEPTAPAPLEIAASSGDQAMAAIVSTVVGPGASPALKTIRVSQGVSNGLLLKRVPPVYPTLALEMRVAGPVELQATINKDGSTANVQVLKGDSVLRPAAVNAVRQWKYKPYLLDGQAIEIVTEVTVNFVLPQ